MDVGNVIKIRRQELGYTLEELGKLVGVGKSTVRKWENGMIENMGRDKIAMLAKALNLSPMVLLDMEDFLPAVDLKANFSDMHPITTQKIPVLGEIRCGEPTFAQEERLLYVMVGAEVKADFALICRGDSMIDARINDGDIVFIRKQDIVNNGEIAAVIIDDEATLKRFYYYRDKNLIILKPANSAYEDIILTGEQLDHVRVLGKAVAFQSDVE